METPASADRQAALQGRESDFGNLAVPARYEGRKDGPSGASGGDEEWEGLEEIGYAGLRGRAGESVATRVGRGHPRLYFSFVFLSSVLLFLCLLLSAAFGGKEIGTPHWGGMVACGLLQVTPVGDGKVGENVFKSPPVALGQRRSRSHAWPFGPHHSGVKITD